MKVLGRVLTAGCPLTTGGKGRASRLILAGALRSSDQQGQGANSILLIACATDDVAYGSRRMGALHSVDKDLRLRRDDFRTSRQGGLPQ